MLEPIDQEDYKCPAEKLPYEFSNWNTKNLSPVCRDWFTQQEEESHHLTISDLFLTQLKQSDQDTFKLAACSPVFKQDFVHPLRTSEDFYGALCTDISPAESMDEYFPDYGDAGFVLFN